MPISVLKGENIEVKLWVPLNKIEDGAQQQIQNVLALPWVEHVNIMPDVHMGFGVPVGSVVAMRDAVAPGMVGVDIGCGMAAYRTNLTEEWLADPDVRIKLRERIEGLIPHGTGGGHQNPLEEALANKELQEHIQQADQTNCSMQKALQQLGSLGSGNHFIEVCVDLDHRVWLMLHSGSRNFGLQIADSYGKKAEVLSHNQNLPDKKLSAFMRGDPNFDAYWRDMLVAQEYARFNRELMMGLLIQAFEMERFCIGNIDIKINCHHNYAMDEIHGDQTLIVARKGAISARVGEFGIIPGAMGRKSFIVEGLGNEESLQSASHGAGRKMSRSKANKTFSLDDLRATTQGVECYVGKGVLDEIALAYKDIDQVMANQVDLVKPIFELRSILTVKGHDDQRKREHKQNEKKRDNNRRELRKLKRGK